MGHRRVSAQEAAALIAEGWLHLDVRSVAEFEAGHPAGAYNVPFAIRGPRGLAPNPEFIATMLRAFGRDAPLVLDCQSGGRSAQAAGVLLREGFTRIVDQQAGYGGVRGPFGQVLERGWQASGLPCAARAERGRSWAELRERRTPLMGSGGEAEGGSGPEAPGEVKP
ncbi:MAG: rhodanese-like domain-containing protein [Myxococcales bacterium]|nr:rhodanese-like domain-containing protein [Myxococcales bacterium]